MSMQFYVPNSLRIPLQRLLIEVGAKLNPDLIFGERTKITLPDNISTSDLYKVIRALEEHPLGNYKGNIHDIPEFSYFYEDKFKEGAEYDKTLYKVLAIKSFVRGTACETYLDSTKFKAVHGIVDTLKEDELAEVVKDIELPICNVRLSEQLYLPDDGFHSINMVVNLPFFDEETAIQFLRNYCVFLKKQMENGLCYMLYGKNIGFAGKEHLNLNKDLFLELAEIPSNSIQQVVIKPVNENRFEPLTVFCLVKCKRIEVPVYDRWIGIYVGKGGTNIKEVSKQYHKHISLVSINK